MLVFLVASTSSVLHLVVSHLRLDRLIVRPTMHVVEARLIVSSVKVLLVLVVVGWSHVIVLPSVVSSSTCVVVLVVVVTWVLPTRAHHVLRVDFSSHILLVIPTVSAIHLLLRVIHRPTWVVLTWPRAA